MARRISIFTFGSRGDTQPFCVLGRALQQAGYEVELCAPEPYAPFVEAFGLKLRPVGSALATLKDSEAMSGLVRGGLARAKYLPKFYAEARNGVADLLSECWQATETSDAVVYMPTTFFVAEFARMRGIESVKVSLQPVLPTAGQASSNIGGGDRGAILNRLSYELPRIASPILWSASGRFKSKTDRRFSLGILPNPMTFRAAESLNLLAFSAAISADPGDWPGRSKLTGAWFYQAEPDWVLAPEVRDFLARGPAIYVGFGSMKWNMERSSKLVMDAIKLWGGRALITSGWGGMAQDGDIPDKVMFTGPVHHSLLFPEVSAVVHHGGAGTTAEGLRHGRPTLILPLFLDQYYWGGRVEALGAGPPALPMKKMTVDALARRLDDLVSNQSYRAGAASVSAAISREPGVAAAVAEIARLVRN